MLCNNFLLALKLRYEDVIIIISGIIITVILIVYQIYRMNQKNLRLTTIVLIELEILINDFKKAIDWVKLFKGDKFSTELEIHNENYLYYRELINKLKDPVNKKRKALIKPTIFDVQRDLYTNKDVIRWRIRREIITLVSYLLDLLHTKETTKKRRARI